ncbi:MAG: enoyl-CoA hydratase/isomerase family protein [bacterium]|nr:enoyl-CoA hydratase/isomerase family protein [bacterium]
MSKVDASVFGDVGILEINNPPMNVITQEVMNDLIEGFRANLQDKAIRVVIVTGKEHPDKKSAFSAGASIDMLNDFRLSGDRQGARRAMKALHEQLFKIDDSPKPVVAAVNGYCFGGGFELALACDRIIASPNAVFGLPEVTLGIIPGWGGTQRLARKCGTNLAAWMILSGKKIPADGAFMAGIADALGTAKGEDFHRQAIAYGADAGVADRGGWAVVAGTLRDDVAQAHGSGNAKFAVEKAAEAIRRGLHLGMLRPGIEIEIECFLDCLFSPDGAEGIGAFLEKRKPNFSAVI